MFDWDESLVDAVLARCTEVDSGARNVDHILTGTLLPQIAEEVLARMAEGVPVQRVLAVPVAMWQGGSDYLRGLQRPAYRWWLLDDRRQVLLTVRRYLHVAKLNL